MFISSQIFMDTNTIFDAAFEDEIDRLLFHAYRKTGWMYLWTTSNDFFLSYCMI